MVSKRFQTVSQIYLLSFMTPPLLLYPCFKNQILIFNGFTFSYCSAVLDRKFQTQIKTEWFILSLFSFKDATFNNFWKRSKTFRRQSFENTFILTSRQIRKKLLYAVVSIPCSSFWYTSIFYIAYPVNNKWKDSSLFPHFQQSIF